MVDPFLIIMALVSFDFIPDMLSKTSIDLVKELKKAHDPSNIFGASNGILANPSDS